MNRLLLAFVLACGLLSACGSGSGSNSSDSAGGSTATGELVYFNPTHLPAGYEIVRTDLQSSGTGEDPTWSAKVGRSTGANKFGDVITVFVSHSDPAVDSNDHGYEPVDVNGHVGKRADTPISGAIVSWKQDGLDIGVIGPPGKLDDALGVGRAVRVSADLTETRLENLPSGMDVVAQWGSTGFPRKRYTINAESTDANARIESLRISVTVVPTDLPVALLGAGHEVDASSQVRDHGAWLYRSANDIGGRPFEQFSLSWGERADLVVDISGIVSVDELRAVAEGLKEESEQQWRTHTKVH